MQEKNSTRFKNKNFFYLSYIHNDFVNKKVIIDNEYHNFYELYLSLSNDISYRIDNKVFKLNYGNMIIVDKYSYHNTLYENHRQNRYLVQFDDDIITLLGSEEIKNDFFNLLVNKKLSLDNLFLKQVTDFFKNKIFPSYVNSNDIIDIQRTKLLFSDLILSFLKFYDEKVKEQTGTFIYKKERKIKDIIEYIDLNYMYDLSLNMLSEKFSISKYYLSRRFKQVSGLCITEYVNRLRIKKAEYLLLNTELSITLIAQRTGYNNLNYFIKIFKKKHNCTPAKFRN